MSKSQSGAHTCLRLCPRKPNTIWLHLTIPLGCCGGTKTNPSYEDRSCLELTWYDLENSPGQMETSYSLAAHHLFTLVEIEKRGSND